MSGDELRVRIEAMRDVLRRDLERAGVRTSTGEVVRLLEDALDRTDPARAGDRDRV